MRQQHVEVRKCVRRHGLYDKYHAGRIFPVSSSHTNIPRDRASCSYARQMPFHISMLLPAGPVQQSRRIPENSGVRLRKTSI